MHVKLWLESLKSHLGSEGINGLVKYQRGIREIAVMVWIAASELLGSSSLEHSPEHVCPALGISMTSWIIN